MNVYVCHIYYKDKVIGGHTVRTWERFYCRDQRKGKIETCPQYTTGRCDLFNVYVDCHHGVSPQRVRRCQRCIEAFGEG